MLENKSKLNFYKQFDTLPNLKKYKYTFTPFTPCGVAKDTSNNRRGGQTSEFS